MKWLKRGGYALLALLLAALPAYWWLLVESHPPGPARYAIDLAEVRRLASVQPGEKPLLIRVETVAQFSAPKTFVVAGDGWQKVGLPVSSYELVYGDHQALVDTGLNANIARAMSATWFDPAAFSRTSGAMARAGLILVTHEHPDHVGGLLAQADLEKRLAAARLTREQVAELKADLNSDPFLSLHLPATIFNSYRPLDYARYAAVAPGVVLIKAPGHTPGSQMIYVERADGAEFLCVGDVAWRLRKIETGREKARLITWMTGEDRRQVLDELAALNRLHRDDPELHMVPGHDRMVIDALLKSGLLQRGF